MSVVRRNVFANMLGGAWTAILSLAFIPLYIHFLGIEAYGLVGFYITLLVLFSVLDMGLTATVSRELARLSAHDEKGVQEMRDLMHTLETVYWGLAMFIVLMIGLAAPWIATSWLNTNHLSPETTTTAVMLMGATIAFRMPYGFYAGGLIGLQKQVQLNWLKVVVETLRNGGAVLVLWLLSPTITAFFVWQAFIGVFGAFLMRAYVWRNIRKTTKPSGFTPSIFKRIWRFGAGMSGLTVLSLLLVEMDKIILSKMLPLADFGFYMLASTIAMGLNLIIVPIFSAIHPRFTQLVASQDTQAVTQLYHKGCQLMTVLVVPLALTVSFNSEQVLHIWTQDPQIARFASPILSLLIIGTAFNAMMNIPYALQLAHGWLRLSIATNVIAAIILVPSLIWMIGIYGVIGAASIWLALNIGYVIFNLPVVHAKLLPGEYLRWLVFDFGIPALAALATSALFWYAMPAGMSMVNSLLWITFALVGAMLASALATPAFRAYLPRGVQA